MVERGQKTEAEGLTITVKLGRRLEGLQSRSIMVKLGRRLEGLQSRSIMVKLGRRLEGLQSRSIMDKLWVGDELVPKNRLRNILKVRRCV